jgi:hypothetical protein
MCSSHTEPHVAADLPVFLERANSLPELSRIGFGAAGSFRFLLRGALTGPACPPKRI